MTALELLKHLRAAGVGQSKLDAVREKLGSFVGRTADDVVEALVDSQFDPGDGSMKEDTEFIESCRAIAARTGKTLQAVIDSNGGPRLVKGRGKMVRDWTSTIRRAKDIAAGVLPVVKTTEYINKGRGGEVEIGTRTATVYEYPTEFDALFAEELEAEPTAEPEPVKRPRGRPKKEVQPEPEPELAGAGV